jgi:23S rRNA pseudouridine2605 synthase
MRLNAYLSLAGVASRRKADLLIKDGRVKVNGQPGNLNDQVSESDLVEVDSKPINLQKYRYVLLHKPAGVVTTANDPRRRPTVTGLINLKEKAVPVGRLDQDTTGALLLTNDGPLAYKLAHPSFEIKKVYQVKVLGRLDNKILDLLSNGVKLEDGITAPAAAITIAPDTIELSLHEGRKRQVKRMIKAVGLQFVSLHRSQYGPLKLDGLNPGQWRELSDREVKQLKSIFRAPAA